MDKFRSPMSGTGVALLVAAVSAVPVTAFGQAYPTKPIRLIVPFGPGTGSDVLGRVIAQKMSEQMGQTVVIDNRPGASGAVGTELGARSAPDGYTLTLATNATLVTYPTLTTTVRYRADQDFVPISFFARTSMVMITANLPATPKSIAELVSQAKAKRVSFASNGAGTIGHLATELFLLNQKLEATHVAYKGSGQSHTDVIRGEVLFMTDTPAAALNFIRNGRLRALAVTGDSRLEALPDVPTFEEAGIPNMGLYAWWGIFGPVGTSQSIARKVAAEVHKAVQSPDIKARLRSLELQEFSLPPEKFSSFIQSELRFWQDFLQKSGIRLDP